MPSREKKGPENREDSTSEIMHRLKTHPFLFIGTVLVLVIVIVAFVFLPMPGLRTQSGAPDFIFGYYDKIPIRYARDNYFYQVLQSITQRQQQPASDDPNYTYLMARQWRQAFDAAVVHTGMLDEVKKAGYIVPDAVVDRQVAELPQFQENGRFSAFRYRAMDNTSRMSLWRQVQESLALQAYASDLSGLRTASKEAAFVSSMSSPKRSFDAAFFPFSSYPDSEILSFARDNAALFRVTHLSRITINSSEREARQVFDSVKNGTTTFEEAAKTNSQDEYAEKGGDMGVQMAFELQPLISDDQAREKIINLSKGDISDPVKVVSGWAFFRAEEAVRPADTNDKTQKDKIRTYIMVYSRGKVEDWLIAAAGKFSSQVKTMGFKEAAVAGNITSHNFGPIPVNYGNTALFGSVSSSGIPELADAGTNEFFWKAAFSTPLKSPSDPVVIGNNVVVLYPLEESTADANETGMIATYYPYWMMNGTEQAYQLHFLTSDKLDDRFNDMFSKIWRKN